MTLTAEQIIQQAAEMLRQQNQFKAGMSPVSHTTAYMTDGSVQSYTQIEVTRRPDGVWEMAQE
jgi:hypothetical protein